MADRDRLSRAISEAVSRAVRDALESALPQTSNRVSHNVAIGFKYLTSDCCAFIIPRCCRFH